MMTALTIIAALAVVCSIIAIVVVSVTFRQALYAMSRAHERRDERHDERLSAILDRFQAIQWEDLAAMRSLQDTTDEGGFLTPAEQAAESVVEIDDQIRWGPASRLRAAAGLSDTERQLLEEDFPDDFAAEVTQ
jgi:hypothetical protein